MNYTGSDPYLTLIQFAVCDTAGNNNGILDPGETVDLSVALRNVGGIDLTNLTTTLYCSDPHITIGDSSSYFGYLAIDSTKENTDDPFNITASASTPNGYSADFMLLTVDGVYVDTFVFSLVIGGRDYLIWNPDPTPLSGELIHSILTSLGYSGLYTLMLPVSNLQTYRAIFVCAGVPSGNYVIGGVSPEASALVEYVNLGGCLYIEGADVWYYDPLIGGYNFCPLFGINAVADGAGTVGPIIGQPGTFTEGMFFYYAGANYSIDQIYPATDSAKLLFLDYDNGYGCAVSHNAITYQTVGTSFELGALVDLGGVSTRSALLDSIMHFFGVYPTGIREQSGYNVMVSSISIRPNPFQDVAEISLSVQDDVGEIDIRVFDATGRLIKDFSRSLSTSAHDIRIRWDGTDMIGRRLSPGVYFIHVSTKKNSKHPMIRKVVLIQ